MRVARVVAVWRRNFLVWRKLAAASLVYHFGDPFLYLLGLGYGLGRFIGDMQGMPYMAFLASGILCSSAMNTATFEGTYSAFTRMSHQQTWEGMLVTPVSLADIVLGEALWAASKSVISGSAILLVACLLGGVVHGQAVWLAIPIIFITGLCFACLALVVCALSPNYDFFLYYFTLVISPMFLFCGVFYPISALPVWLQATVQVLPLTHAIDLIRPLLGGLDMHSGWMHLAVLLVYASVAYMISLRLFQRRLLR